jgi:hypothetical protein
VLEEYPEIGERTDEDVTAAWAQFLYDHAPGWVVHAVMGDSLLPFAAERFGTGACVDALQKRLSQMHEEG